MSTEAKHTNYKVVFEKNETRPCKMYISSGNRNVVASVNNDPETVAMFQLFAAAPDMLEALEEAIEILERISYNDGYAHSVALTVQRAIAKAKGAQP
jgi:hypothetical protein